MSGNPEYASFRVFDQKSKYGKQTEVGLFLSLNLINNLLVYKLNQMHSYCRFCRHAFNTSQCLCPNCNNSIVMLISSPSTYNLPQSTSRPSIVDQSFHNNLPKSAAYMFENESLLSQKVELANLSFLTSLEVIDGEVDCAICMENVPYGKITFICGHSLDALCALQWLWSQNTCPICRIALFEI